MGVGKGNSQSTKEKKKKIWKRSRRTFIVGGVHGHSGTAHSAERRFAERLAMPSSCLVPQQSEIASLDHHWNILHGQYEFVEQAVPGIQTHPF